ncbi:MAG TPA: FtsX-like permease family protein [Puia sp.]|nr:FtsX-like permease family protein [Puia sp.]
MIRNYLKLAFRHLLRKKTFTAINVFGLTIGLTGCLLIGLFIADELSFDRFHVNAARIARVTSEYSMSGTVNPGAVTGTRVGPRFQSVFPAVESYTRTFVGRAIIGKGVTHFEEDHFLWADSTFFRIFTFPILSGDPDPLSSEDNLVITQSAAKKYFGEDDPIGKILRVRDEKNYRIAAVIADPPGNSQLQFDFVTRFENLHKPDEWWTANWITYLLLRDPNGFAPLERQINAYMQSPAIRNETGAHGNDYLIYHLEPLTRVHLYSKLDGFTPNGSITTVYVLTIIAILILTIACFNYTNLAIAQSTSRMGEIGVRKVLGAAKSQLFTQFTGESLLITLLAMILAIAVSIQLLPAFNSLTGKHLDWTSLLRIRPLILLLATTVLIGFLAGAYPALVLSNTRLINILRSGFRITGSRAGLRNSLVVLQFAISLFLIITTIVILRQMNYIEHKDLGFDRDHVVVLPIDYRIHDRYPAVKTAISQLPGVVNISGSYNLPVSVGWQDGITANNGKDQVVVSVHAIPTDLDFISTMNMHLIAGKDFTRNDLPAITGKDTTQPLYRFILNESAVRKIGWTPDEAIGKRVSKGQPGIVVGVVRDFNFTSLRNPIGPLIIFPDTSEVHYMLVRVNGNQLPAELDRMQATWKSIIPDRPFSYHFLDEDYDRLYQSEQRTGQLFTLFSALAILLALLGLFGLAAISTVQRTKEIGIRKVLGAGSLHIALLLARNFILLIIVAFGIATPVAWIVSANWLNNFSYRITLPVWTFPLAGIGVLLIAFATVSYHAWRASRLNPAISLKEE